MNIAILSRGIIRSGHDKDPYSLDYASIDFCRQNINSLSGALENHGSNWVQTYFCSWAIPKTIEAARLGVFDNTIILKEKTEEDARGVIKKVPILYRREGHPYYNRHITTYGMFSQTKAAIGAIKSSNESFDYICITRPDLCIHITNIEQWLTDRYEVPFAAHVFFNDNFAIAPAEIMYKVWDFGFDEINTLCESRYDPEDVLKAILENRKISFNINKNISHYSVREVDFLQTAINYQFVIDLNNVNGYRIEKK